MWGSLHLINLAKFWADSARLTSEGAGKLIEFQLHCGFITAGNDFWFERDWRAPHIRLLALCPHPTNPPSKTRDVCRLGRLFQNCQPLPTSKFSHPRSISPRNGTAHSIALPKDAMWYEEWDGLIGPFPNSLGVLSMKKFPLLFYTCMLPTWLCDAPRISTRLTADSSRVEKF